MSDWKDTVMSIEGIIILSHMNPEIIEGIIKDILGKQAEISFKVGMEKVVKWVTNREKHYSNPHFKFDKEWQAFLKSNNL